MKIKSDLENTADYKMINKNNAQDPVGQLTEKYGKIHWSTLLISGVHNKCCFKVSAIINGNKFMARGTTLETAKKLCALAALKEIPEENPNSDSRMQMRDVEAAVAKKNCIPTISEEIGTNYTKNKRDIKLKSLQNITNLQLCSKYNTEKNINNPKLFNDKSVDSNLKSQYNCKRSNPGADVIESDCDIANENVNNITYSENNALVLKRNEKVSGDSPLQNKLHLLIGDDEENNVINLPSSSRVCRNVFGNNPEHKNSGLQSICESIGKKKKAINTTNFSDVSSVLTTKLNISTTQTMDMVNVQTIEMNVLSIKSFTENPIGDAHLLSNQEKTITKILKRRREENIDVNEQPPSKIQATDKNNVISKQSQWRQQRDAVKNLKKLHPNLKFTFESKIGSLKEPYFMVSAVVDNRKFFGHGKTEYLAEKDAAIQILNSDKLLNNSGPPGILPNNNENCQQIVLPNESNQEICSSLLLPTRYADIIESKIMQAFDNLTNGHKEVSRYKVLAGIIMTFDMNFEDSLVVSIATGTKCVNGGNICCNGSVLNDSHAEVIAKRGLKKFLFTQLKHHCSYEALGRSVLERTATGFRLKPYVHFHLYINTSPCGDARVFNFNHKYKINNMFETSFNSLQYGQLRTKVEGDLGTTPIGSRFYSQTWDGILLGEPLHTMSCSDKIALWNVAGIQGALLSQFVEPIYLHSITLGSLFDAQHLYRAICGRIQDTLGHLPQSYRLNRPLLGQTSKQLRRYVFNAPSIGINWTAGDRDLEIISLPTGRSVYNQTSFLSKQAFFFKYFYLCNNLPNIGCANASNIYAEAKQNSQDYQNAKRAVFEAFYRANLGNWVKKPKEQNEFAMNINLPPEM